MQWDKEMEACISYFKELAFTITINKLISAGETEELYITLVAAKSNEKALWVSDITQVSISLSCFQIMQPVFTCLKLTIETPEQCMKFAQS